LMRVPLSWLAEYVDVPESTTAEQVAADLVRVGLEEEGLLGADVSGRIVVGRVLTFDDEPQKNGKTIRWCQVDVGADHNVGGKSLAEGGEPRGIVCGASNFAVDDLVVVALPGSVLPGGFAISARKTYGHVSDGMICSARELGLGDDHTGIIVLGDWALEAEPGDDATQLLGLTGPGSAGVEVNVTPDRGYCLSVRGIGREYAHATHRPVEKVFRDPAALDVPDATPDGPPVVLADGQPINGVPGCQRFVARVVRGVDGGAQAPFWMRRRLQQAGMRSISLVVDVTNYVLLALGQPLHAYDLARLDGPITVRRARARERLRTLDGVVHTLDPEDLLITDGPDGARPIGLAGVMGGGETEVSTSTRDVLIEAAWFDPVTVARTARRHKLPSEASKRFERTVDPELQPAAAELAVRLLVEHGVGAADPDGTDVDEHPSPSTISLEADLPTRLVGVPYPRARVVELLHEIGCQVERSGDDTGNGVLLVTPPSWRPDLVQGADLVEEVARLDGYEHIPSVLPVAPPGRGLTFAQQVRRRVSRALADAGFVAVLSYPFVAPERHDQLGLPDDDPRRCAVRLSNPLSDEQPLLRTSVLSTLVDTVRRNLGRGFADLALFEVGLVTRPAADLPPVPAVGVTRRPGGDELAALEASVPAQPQRVAAVLTGLAEPAGWWGGGRPADHTDAIAAALLVADALGVPVQVTADEHAPWHPGRCARLSLPDATLVGHAGELHPRVLQTLELPPRTCAFELDLDVLTAASGRHVDATPISSFPVAKEDVALVVDAAVPAAEVEQALRDGAGALLESLRLFDVYTGEQVGQGRKSLAFALRLRAPDRTLTAADANAVRDAAVAEAARRVGAEQRT
ncbi:MAG: phenylalanine--tRNA ligase subunit beta, partial [Actinomycetes bacterium]